MERYTDVPKLVNAEDRFSVVEIAIITILVVLLAVIVIPNYFHAREQADANQSQANIKQIVASLDLYFNDHRRYPAGVAIPVSSALFGGPTNSYLQLPPINAISRAQYRYTAIVEKNGQASFAVADPSPYDNRALTNISMTVDSAMCTPVCTHIAYSPRSGMHGTK